MLENSESTMMKNKPKTMFLLQERRILTGGKIGRKGSLECGCGCE